MSRLAAVLITIGLGLLATACKQPAPTSRTPTAVDQSSAKAGVTPTSLRGEGALGYISETAKGLIQDWQPLKFTGTLKAYHPDQFGSLAFDKLLQRACKDNTVWRRIQAFRDQMGEIPTAVSTPGGPVLYEAAWDKGAWGRTTFVGVRVNDRECGGFDLVDGDITANGDGDVVAALVAAAAIRSVSAQSDRARLAPALRDQAIGAVAGVVQTISAGPQPEVAEARQDRPAFAQRAVADLNALKGMTEERLLKANAKPIASITGRRIPVCARCLIRPFDSALVG